MARHLIQWPDAQIDIAMHALRLHYEEHDPYIDDYPSARHAAAAHRAGCAFCKAYEKLPKVKEQETKDDDDL